MNSLLSDYEHALSRLLATAPEFGGGLSNHGPMASEALVSLGEAKQLGPFIDAYLPRLEPAENNDSAPADWRGWLRAELPRVVPFVARTAGHGLLRVAHAVRGLERAEATGAGTTVYRRELYAAMAYWDLRRPIVPAPAKLVGTLDPIAWATGLPRLSAEARSPGLLTATLRTAGSQPDFSDCVASLQSAASPVETLDALAMASLEFYLANTGLSEFTFLHGVTVPTMARHLVPHLDVSGADQVVAGVAAFVAAAIIGFDDGGSADDAVAELSVHPTTLAHRAAETLEDHTIKLADACLGLALRTGSERPLLALEYRLR